MCRAALVSGSKRTGLSKPRTFAPLTVLAIIPFLPKWVYINRGFTQWFHWVAIIYLLTAWEFLERFQAMIGFSICLGWYCSIIYAAYQHGEFMTILYENMPDAIKHGIFDNETDRIDYTSPLALKMMLVAHMLDFLGHPLLTFFFWYRHRSRGGTLSEILTWPVILSTYLFSRIWSLTHTTYNFGQPGFFYVGHDVYIVENLDCWIPAYVAESVVYLFAVVYKIFLDRKPSSIPSSKILNGQDDPARKLPCTTSTKKSITDTKAPRLVYSNSTMSFGSSTRSLDSSKGELSTRPSSTGTDWSQM